jgi:hypothetical protein
MRAIIIILALVALSTIARSDGIYNPTGGQVGFADGINNLGAGTGGTPPPTGCQGAVDASAGCPLPMIGV